jgi:hypothetical protein
MIMVWDAEPPGQPGQDGHAGPVRSRSAVVPDGRLLPAAGETSPAAQRFADQLLRTHPAGS